MRFGGDEDVGFDLEKSGGRNNASVISMAAEKANENDEGFRESFKERESLKRRQPSSPRASSAATKAMDTYTRIPYPPPGRRADWQAGPPRSPGVLQRAESFGSHSQKHPSMPERMRTMVSGGSASNARSSVHLRRNTMMETRPRSRPRPSLRSTVPSGVRADVGVAQASAAFGSKSLDDDVKDEGGLHTRYPAFRPPDSPECGGSSAGETKGGSSRQGPGPAPISSAGVRPEELDPVWKKVGEIAPNAMFHAEQIETKHLELRADLARTRDAIQKSKFGQIEHSGASPDMRVQQRTAHATYSYLMRQRKARDLGQKQQDAWKENYVMR